MAQDTMIDAAVTGGLDVSDRYTYVCVLNFSGGGGGEGRVPATPPGRRGPARLGLDPRARRPRPGADPTGESCARGREGSRQAAPRVLDGDLPHEGRGGDPRGAASGAGPSARRDRGSWQGARPLRAARGRPGNDAVSRDGGAAAGPGRRGPDRAELRPHAGGPRALCQEPCGRIVSRTAT